MSGREEKATMSRGICIVLSVVLSCCGFATRAAAETHAVVVGIDNYTSFKHLNGARNDANDIVAALKKAGVTDVTPLIDENATRKNVLGAIDQLIKHVQKDDLAIITFAGHGAREQWGKVRPPGTELKGLHEVFLLRNMVMPDIDGKIDPSVPGSAAERILGAEMAIRLKRLDDLGARTIFVADSCFGGGLSRQSLLGVDYSIRVVSETPFFADGADPLQPEIKALPAPFDVDKEARSLSFLAAVSRDFTAPEVEIPKGSKNMRGALSYAFARVLEGAALQNGKSELTHGDLVAYLMNSIKNSLIDSGTSQRPDLRPKQGFDRVAIRFGSDLKLASSPQQLPPPKVGSVLRVYSEKGKSIEPLKRPELDLTVEPTTDRSQADFIYLADRGDFYSKGGDLIVSKMLPVDIADIAEREIAIRKLLELAKTRPRTITVDRGDQRYLAGQEMSLDARRSAGEARVTEYYALLIISGNGLVQFMYPDRLKNDSMTLPEFPLGHMQAGEPFGADYAVLVTDQKPMDDLVKSLKGLNGSRSSNAVATQIAKALTPTMKIGLQAIYTAPKP